MTLKDRFNYSWRYLNVMLGANRNRLKLGDTLTTCGLIMAAVGLVVTKTSLEKFDPREADADEVLYNDTEAFADAILSSF